MDLAQLVNNPIIMTILIVFAIFVAVRLISGVVKLAVKIALIVGVAYAVIMIFRTVTG